MSTGELLWYCHECHAEMRPLMAPDPVCASCHGSFVEKMENPADDPRNFAHEDGIIGPDLDGVPPGVDNFFMGLQTLLERGMRPNPTQTQRSTQNSSSFTFEVRDRNGFRTIRLGGGANPLGQDMDEDQSNRPGSPNSAPNMSTFVHSNIPHGQGRPTIPGALLAQYLMSMMGNNDHAIFGMPEDGRMGDYVFNQEALDQIITQLMENSNANRPVPATDEIIDRLDREVLTVSSSTLQKDCAVCKEQFKLETEDPDELVVVTLPCKHPFHEPCILPWLKSSGTCPVCRHALVPQPENHPTPPLRSNTGPDSGGTSNHRRNSGPGSPGPGGLFHTLFGGFHGLEGHSSGSTSNNNGSRVPNNDSRPSSQRPRSPQHRRSHGPSRRNTGRDHLPGGWSEELD